MASNQDQQSGQGQGWHGDSAGHAKAGKMGGEATAKSHDRGFYEEIGSEGGNQSPTKFQTGDSRTQKAARKGGKASGSASSSLDDPSS
jgi:general stress protein YciG